MTRVSDKTEPIAKRLVAPVVAVDVVALVIELTLDEVISAFGP